MSAELTPELMLGAYAAGYFPMADEDDPESLNWYDPDPRGILPLNGFHLPRRLRRTVLSERFAVTVNTDFPAVMRGCAAPAPGRETTWINTPITRIFCALHDMGFAHSVECRLDGVLVGGLYGVALGGAFFGESMFSTATDAPRWRWCILSPGCGFAVLFCWIPSLAPAISPVLGERKFRPRITRLFWPVRWTCSPAGAMTLIRT